MTPEAGAILVIKHGALGDIILASGALKAIRQQHPNAAIALLTAKPYDALLANCPFIDSILIDPKPKLWEFAKIRQLKALLQSRRWEWVYDLQTSQRTTCYFPLLRTRYYSGLSPKGSHPHLTPERTSLHTLDRLAQQLSLAGISVTPAPDISWLEAEPPHTEKPMVLLVAGGAPHRPAKRWPAEHYAALAAKCLEKGYTPVLIGTQAEEEILRLIAQTDARIVNLIGQTSFAQLASLARSAAYAIGNDTGPMHIIAAAGCPCTIVFNTGESTPHKSAPRGEHVSVLARDDLAALEADEVAAGLPNPPTP